MDTSNQYAPVSVNIIEDAKMSSAAAFTDQESGTPILNDQWQNQQQKVR